MNFLENVLGKGNSFWKYLVTVVVAFLAQGTIGALPLFIVVHIFNREHKLTSEMYQNLDFTSIGISENLSLLLILISFAIGLLAIVLLIRSLHKRSFSETVNGTKKVRWNRILMGFFVWFLLTFLLFVISYIISPENFVVQFNIQTFIPLFFIVLVFIPLQVTFEELLFRGYLAQGIGSWTKNRWLVVLIPSVLFGLMHSSNAVVSIYGFWEMIPQYILMGLIWGFASVLDDGIELAIGMHAADNIFILLFVASDPSLKTPAVLHQQTINNPQIDTITLLLSGLIAMFIFAKKYKWNFSVMNKKIKPNTQQI